MDINEKCKYIKKPEREDFISGELYCVSIPWTFYTNKNLDEYSSAIPAMIPFMFLSITSMQGIFDFDGYIDIIEILFGDKVLYHTWESVYKHLNSDDVCISKLYIFKEEEL